MCKFRRIAVIAFTALLFAAVPPLPAEDGTDSKDEEKVLMDLFHKGYGFNTIAKRLNKTANGVRGKLEAIGYKFDNGMPVKRHG